MFCTKCGMNNPDSAAFCSGCGAPMAKRTANPESQPQQAQYQQTQQNAPKNGGSAGKVILAVILTVVILAGLAVGAYFLFLRDSDGDSKSTSTSTSKVTDEVKDDDDSPAGGDDVPDSDEDKAEYIEDVLDDAVEKLQSYGSWSEDCVMEYDMTYSGQTMSISSRVMANVYGYAPDDPSSMRIEGSGRVEGAGTEQEWTYVYEDGEATYNYIKPTVSSTTVDMDPSLFNMDSLESDMIKNVKISGNNMSFTIDSDAAMNRLDMMESVIGADTGITGLEYSDIKVKFTVDDDTGVIDDYYMAFSADITANGITMTADYEVDFSFEVLK